MSQLIKAEMQLIRFAHASKGYSIIDLAQSMGLTKTEWEKLRDNSSLKQSDKLELDKHFKI